MDNRDQYAEIADPLVPLGRKVESLILDLLQAESVEVHNVSHRLKSRASAERKLSNKTSASTLHALTDVLGVRVISYFSDQVDLVASIVEREFEVDEANSVDKRAL